MKKNLIKVSLFVLLLSVVLTFAIIEMNAIGDTACRGTEWCDEIEEACFEGELLGWRKIASICEGWGVCKSYFHVACWDDEEDASYTRYVDCYSPAMGDECQASFP